MVSRWFHTLKFFFFVLFCTYSDELATRDKDLCGCGVHGIQFGPHQVKTCTPQSRHDELQRECIVVRSFFFKFCENKSHFYYLNSKSLKKKHLKNPKSSVRGSVSASFYFIETSLRHPGVQCDHHRPPSQAPRTPSCSSELWGRSQINSVPSDLWLWRNSAEHNLSTHLRRRRVCRHNRHSRAQRRQPLQR